jgi:hypothetical protein
MFSLLPKVYLSLLNSAQYFLSIIDIELEQIHLINLRSFFFL